MLSEMVPEKTGMAKMFRMKMCLPFVLRREQMRYEPFDSLLRELQTGSMGTRNKERTKRQNLGLEMHTPHHSCHFVKTKDV